MIQIVLIGGIFTRALDTHLSVLSRISPTNDTGVRRLQRSSTSARFTRRGMCAQPELRSTDNVLAFNAPRGAYQSSCTIKLRRLAKPNFTTLIAFSIMSTKLQEDKVKCHSACSRFVPALATKATDSALFGMIVSVLGLTSC
jgi:hypothetical protein